MEHVNSGLSHLYPNTTSSSQTCCGIRYSSARLLCRDHSVTREDPASSHSPALTPGRQKCPRPFRILFLFVRPGYSALGFW